MLSPRWRKVLRDLWRNKRRTLLVVLSVAVGVFSVGAVAHMQVLARRDMRNSYTMASPANAVIYTEAPFDEDLVEVIRDMPEVAEAEGRSSFIVRFQRSEDEGWYPMELHAVPDYEDMRINIIRPQIGFDPGPEPWPGPVPLPPPEREMVVERTSLLQPAQGLAGSNQGDTLLIETPMGKQREMRMAGLVTDFAQMPATFAQMARGFVTYDTFEWLGLPRTYSELLILVAGDRGDVEYIERVAEEVADRVERSGVTVLRTSVPPPGELPVEVVIDALIYILTALGVLSLFSSAFLLINTMQALLAQQVQQIGVMKALGARARQITGMYLSIILFYGLLALAVAAPLGTWIARMIIMVMSYFVNFELGEFGFPPQVLALEAAMGLLVPLLAGLWPILSGARITVREAISSYGLGEGGLDTGLIDRLIERVRGLPRPLLLSLRNTFRRKGRLVLTLVTLTLAGTIFIAIVSVRASMARTVEDLQQARKSDVTVTFGRSYRVERLESAALAVPGVVRAESWGGQGTYRVRPDGSEGESFFLNAPPAETELFEPKIVKGRWLRPEDENGIVVNTYLLEDEPDLDVGDEIVLDIRDREMTWRIVGVVQPVITFAEAYVDYAHFTRMVREVGRASTIYVVTERHDGDFQAQVAEALETHLDGEGLSVNSVLTAEQDRQQMGSYFNILVSVLMSMAILLAAVGGIGLMGTMLLNVLERVREVGVMRAIGASTSSVIQIFVVEGVLIGLIGWMLGTICALLVGRMISDAVGMQLFGISLSYVFSTTGVAVWLVLSILLSIVASFFPAQNAAQITVREVLAYEG
jgi:putative ABC transport system permease protein